MLVTITFIVYLAGWLFVPELVNHWYVVCAFVLLVGEAGRLDWKRWHRRTLLNYAGKFAASRFQSVTVEVRTNETGHTKYECTLLKEGTVQVPELVVEAGPRAVKRWVKENLSAIPDSAWRYDGSESYSYSDWSPLKTGEPEVTFPAPKPTKPQG